MSVFDRPRGDATPAPDPSDSARMRAIEDRLLVLAGADGTNGRFGHLRKTVESHGALFRWLGGAVAGSLITGAVAIYSAGQKDGARERDIVIATQRAIEAERRAEAAERSNESLRAEIAALRGEVRDLARARFGSHRYQPPPAASPGDTP